MVDLVLDAAGVLTFRNAAVDHGFAVAAAGYAATWYAFDNAIAEARPLGRTTGATPQLKAASGLPGAMGVYVRVDLTADHVDHPSWKEPVRALLRATGGRMEAGGARAAARLALRRNWELPEPLDRFDGLRRHSRVTSVATPSRRCERRCLSSHQ